MTQPRRSTRGGPATSRLASCAVVKRLPWLLWFGICLVLVNRGTSVDSDSRMQVTAQPPASLALEKRIRGKDGKEMMLVPAGWFTMGSSEHEAEAAYQLSLKYYADAEHASTERWWFKHEQPRHRVWLDAFYMDTFEVTVGEYHAFMQHAGHRSLPHDVATYAPTSHHPVVKVSWEDATTYCQWAAKRLPTEAEWEKAARGEDVRIYPWGNAALSGSRANYCDAQCPSSWKESADNDGHAYTAPVGAYADGQSPYGIYDLAGNVGEWVQDWYDAAFYHRSAERNPVNDQAAPFRVLRGGSWYLWPVHLRTAHRSRYRPDGRLHNVGFRCVTAAVGPKPVTLHVRLPLIARFASSLVVSLPLDVHGRLQNSKRCSMAVCQ
jgi:formylglycine-generating enzyme required for sulfatase activity